jgi:hypothetical protein
MEPPERSSLPEPARPRGSILVENPKDSPKVKRRVATRIQRILPSNAKGAPGRLVPWRIQRILQAEEKGCHENPKDSRKERQRRSPWAHLDLNQGPHPYQGCALTELSYGPEGARLYQRPPVQMPDGAARPVSLLLAWGCSSARQSTWFATRGSGVQIPSSPPNTSRGFEHQNRRRVSGPNGPETRLHRTSPRSAQR